MVTYIHQPTRTLTILHRDAVEISHLGDYDIIVSYKDKCNTCIPEVFHIEGDVDLNITVTSGFDR